MSWKCSLLKMRVQVKEQVSEAVVHRLQIRWCSSKFFKFPRKTSVLESDKVTGNFVKKRLQHRLFPVKFAKFLRTPFFYRTAPVAASEV